MKPFKQKQVVVKVGTKEGEEHGHEYLVVSNAPFAENALIKVCKLNELQRSVHERREPRTEFLKVDDLLVIAEDLETWIEKWNE